MTQRDEKPALLSWRRSGWLAGVTAAAISVGFLIYSVATEWEAVEPLLWRISFTLLLAGVVAHVASAVAAALVWHGWLEAVRAPMSRPRATSISLTSQIAKYIPGNFAHHVGKAALAGKAGVPMPRVAGSIVGELLSAPVLAVATLALVLLFDPTAISRLVSADDDGIWLRAVAAAVLAMILAASALFPRLMRLALRRFSWGDRDVVPEPGLRIVAWGCIMFAAAGISFHAVAIALAPEAGLSLGFSIAVFTLAWTVGFVTPGAPAGLGVREVLIVAGLSLTIGTTEAIGAAVLHRLATAIGDLLAFALGCYLAFRTREGAAAPPSTAAREGET